MKAGLPTPDLSLTADVFRAAYEYDPETGLFRHRNETHHRQRKGWWAGSRSKNGYLILKVRNRSYLAHRLAWLYVHGTWPACVIDHVNGLRDDNRIENLRDVTWQQNQAARRAKESTAKPVIK